MIQLLKKRIQESIDLKTRLLQNDVLLNTVQEIVKEIVTCYKHDGKVLWAGNGGSAADSQHLAAELSGRFYYCISSAPRSCSVMSLPVIPALNSIPPAASCSSGEAAIFAMASICGLSAATLAAGSFSAVSTGV